MATMKEIKPPTHGEIIDSMEYIWYVLNQYREDGIKWYGQNKPPMDEAEWDEVSTALRWIEDELGLRRDKHGQYEVI